MTLRIGGAIVGTLSVIGGICVLAFARVAWPFGVELVVFGVLLVAGSTFERWRYDPRTARDQQSLFASSRADLSSRAESRDRHNHHD